MENVIYQENAQDCNALQTAQGFARTYFDKPRTIDTFEVVDAGFAKFNLVDGNRTYEVRYVPGKHLVAFPLWKIVAPRPAGEDE